MENQSQHILHLLESSFLFRGLNPSHLQKLAENTKFHTYHPHQTLIEEGLINDKIIIIVQGLVKIYKLTEDGKEIFLGIERNSNYLGVMDLDEKPGSATVEALQPTKALVFHKGDLVTILSQDPRLWERLYRITLAKLRDANQLQSLLIGHELYERTYLLLHFLAQLSDEKTVLLSQETLSTIVGATRPRVTEALRQLKEEGKIRVSPKKITVLPCSGENKF